MDQNEFEKLPLLRDYNLEYLRQRGGGLLSTIVIPDGENEYKIKAYSMGELMLIHYAQPLLNNGNRVEIGKIVNFALQLRDEFLSDTRPKDESPFKPNIIQTIDKFAEDKILFHLKSNRKTKNEFYNPSDVLIKGSNYDIARIEPHFKYESKERIFRKLTRSKIARSMFRH